MDYKNNTLSLLFYILRSCAYRDITEVFYNKITVFVSNYCVATNFASVKYCLVQSKMAAEEQELNITSLYL